jgi:hypothetical protein
MPKKKHFHNQITPGPQVGKRYSRTMDMSDQEYARMLSDAQSPSVGYWVFIIAVAITAIILGAIITRTIGITVGGMAFLTVGLVLSVLIIARIVRDIRERS